LVNSTELLAQLGDERAETLRRTHFRILRDAVADHGGHEVKTMGDGIMVVFASAVDAVRCGAAIQRATNHKGVEVRVGLHVGEPIREEGDYFGTPVVVARRLCDAAAGGQILTSDLVHALVGTRGEFSFHDAGFLALKGITEPVAAWEVAWEPAAPVGLPLPAGLTAGERLPFVGREELLDELRVQWKKARDGHRALVMLAGEPGIGKTRLAAEFAREVHGEGARVLFGHADEETLLPYQPFVEAFHHVVRHATLDDLRDLVADNGAELGRLLPALHDELPGLPEPMRAEPESERFRLFEAATAFTTALAAEAPLVLVLDDLHWADKPTLLLLHHLFRSPTDIGLLVVGTYRDTDLDRRHPLAETLADLRRLVQFERLPVGGLHQDDLNHFIDLVTGQEPPPEFARAVHDQTEGNPFFIGEVLRHLIESGAISVVDGAWVPTAALEQLGIPEGVKEVIGRRLTRLSEDANVALAAAAVAGRDFALDVLERVTEFDEDRLLGAIDEAVTARLVVELPGPVARFHFAHALVRETLYDELTTARRVRMHRRIAQVLESLYGNDAEPPLAQLAYHWFESASAADAGRAIDYAQRAGTRAFEHLAYEEAVGHFERALEAVDLSDDDHDAVRAALFVELGHARGASGDLQGSHAAYDAATVAARTLADGVLLARAALGRAGLFTVGAMDEENVARLEEALRHLPPDDSCERSQVLCRLAIELYWGGDRTRMEAFATDGFEMARRLGDPSALGPGLNVAAVLYDSPAHTERRLALMQEAVQIADSNRDASVSHLARSLAVWSHLEMGDIAGFEATVEAGAAMLAEARLPATTWWIPVWRASRALLQGDVTDAETLALEAFTMGQAAEDPASLPTFGAQLFVVRRDQGRVGELEGTVRSMVEEFPAVPAWRGALALLLAESGRHDEARAELDILGTGDFAGVPRDNLWLITLALVSATSFLTGAQESAAVVYPMLVPFEHRFVTVAQILCEGSVARACGELAAACGRLDDAVTHFESGIAYDRGMTGFRSAIYGQAELAATLARRDGPGDHDRAVALAADTLADAERLGLASIATRVRPLALA
jgi:tetratricopeptide (TPR) repeat protein